MNLKYDLDIYDDIIAGLKDHKVKDVKVGVHGVYVESRNAGISLRYDGKKHSSITDSGNLTEKSAIELSKYLKSWDFAEASVGLAALNSLIEPGGQNLNAFDFLDSVISEGDDIAVIGHFPWVERTKNKANVWVLERKPSESDFPDTSAEYILPKSDFVLATGSSLVNKTLPRILELSENAYTIVLGPSTPISPVLFDYGVDAIAGAKIVNKERVVKMIEQGSTICNLKSDDVEYLMKFNPESKGIIEM